MAAGYRLFETTIGTCGIGWSEYGLVAVQLPEIDVQSSENRLKARVGTTGREPPQAMEACIARLQAYFRSEPADLRDTPLDWTAARPLDRAIYRLLRDVPFGRIVTYGELARLAGMDGAAQAVGAAMSRNPWPIVVPCHRVVAASGKLGGFSAFGGAALKRKLLAMEGASFEAEAPVLPGLFEPRQPA